MMKTSVLSFVLGFMHLVLHTNAQVPRVCADANSLTSKTCCPSTDHGVCGEDAGRGQCVDVSSLCFTGYDDDMSDIRLNWPTHYYTRVCNCTGPYGGYDCSECAFGYTGPNCEKQMTRIRRSVTEHTAADWRLYNEGLRMAKATMSRYVILIPSNISVPDLSTATVKNISNYDLFAWMHIYAALTHTDDYNESTSANDYAHESVGFLTWHRLFLLMLERELQILLDDSSFSIPYWDWTDFGDEDDWNTVLFSEDKLGRHNESGSLFGEYYSGEDWKSICWPPPDPLSGLLCDPDDESGIKPVIRCPNNTACTAAAELFPTRRDIVRALTDYPVWADPDNEDYEPFSKYATKSFCNFLEGFDLQPVENAHPYLSSPITLKDGTVKSMNRALHNVGHIVPGIGNLNTPSATEGTMANVAASPNDPVFINHHSMIDCLFDEWLELYPNSPYVGPERQKRFAGHGLDDCIVPFFPPKTHRQMYKIGLDHGFECDLPELIPPRSSDGDTAVPEIMILTLSLIGTIVAVLD